MGGAGGGSNLVGVKDFGSLLRLSRRSIFIAIWLMMWLFCNWMWGLPLVRQVDCRCVLIWEPFLCFSALLWMTLCAFADGDTSSMMCGTCNGVGGGTGMGHTICGSMASVFLRVVRW